MQFLLNVHVYIQWNKTEAQLQFAAYFSFSPSQQIL